MSYIRGVRNYDWHIDYEHKNKNHKSQPRCRETKSESLAGHVYWDQVASWTRVKMPRTGERARSQLDGFRKAAPSNLPGPGSCTKATIRTFFGSVPGLSFN